MTQLLNIQEDKIVIKTLVLDETSGAVKHTGGFAITESVSIDKDLSVTGTTNVETLRVKNLISESGTIEGIGHWLAADESDINGKGFSWAYGEGTVQLIYRNGGRIWTNGDFDVAKNKSYKIDNALVLSATELGPQVKKSSLTEIGALRSLNVLGNTSIGEFAFFRSSSGRLGLNTDEPNGAFGIVKNNVEVIIDSLDINRAIIGTYTNHDLSLITDNTARVTVKKDGEVHIGNEETKTGVLRVYGTLYADNVISDTRLERTSSLEFIASSTNTIYGKGLAWVGDGVRKELMLKANGRIWSTESIEIGQDKEFVINGSVVLTERGLGINVVNSNLTSVGTLTSLTVDGTAKFLNNVEVKSLSVDTLTTGKLTVNNNFTLSINSQQALFADSNEVVIGNKDNTRRPVKVFGPLSVGISNPDSTVDLAVRGSISFSDKKFVTGSGAPTAGTFKKGDICWNTNPTEFSYVGWVCVADGVPGNWLPFGAITR